MKNINRVGGILLTGSLLTSVSTVWADTYALDAASSGEKQAFDTVGKWKIDGQTVSHTPCAGNDYHVYNGYELGVGVNGKDSTEHIFLGDSLTLGRKGADSSWGVGQLFQDGHGTLVITNLILAQGR